MTRAELDKFVQARIDEKANLILDERVTHDDAAFGELRIYSVCGESSTARRVWKISVCCMPSMIW
jgi:hypothetical protein